MTALSKMQVWTQPIWLLLMVAPFVSIAIQDPGKFAAFTHFGGSSSTGSSFSILGAGAGAGVALSLIAQIGEQVDYLRFMPDKTAANSRRWWAAVLTAGPGWVVLGALKQLGGAFLAFYVAGKVGLIKADQPIQQYLAGLKTFAAPVALGLATFFVVLSQIKINTTNAYSGSLSWSNFFSRILHWHPGRVVWIFLNVGISLALMEGGVFGFLNNDPRLLLQRRHRVDRRGDRRPGDQQAAETEPVVHRVQAGPPVQLQPGRLRLDAGRLGGVHRRVLQRVRRLRQGVLAADRAGHRHRPVAAARLPHQGPLLHARIDEASNRRSSTDSRPPPR